MDLEQILLNTVGKDEKIDDTWELSRELNIDHQKLVGAVKSLLVDRYLLEEPLSTSYWELTAEGLEVANQGAPEIHVMSKIPSEGISLASLNEALGEITVKLGMGVCMKNKWIQKKGDLLVPLLADVEDSVSNILKSILADSSATGIDDKELLNLKKNRKMIVQVTRKSYKITKGPDFKPKRVRKMADLNKSMLGSKGDMAEGSHWTDLEFKSVNLKSMGALTLGGTYHPLLKVRAEFRRILMDMGFDEMPTNKWVESSFWNFDSLFQPQSHPARDAHDTFFMKEPMYTNSVPEEYYEIVKKTHEEGGFGSIGYGCKFKREEAMKNLLRTHTTAVSAQMIYRLMQQKGGFTPKKYFSIDRVFRNEAMDATHLCEFHQVEGMVIDRNLTLGHLIGTIKTFFEKIGITQLRFKPAYNPYTEPSMEIFGYHPDLKKWMEMGNSGMFRPEMLRPMGLPEDVRVIAWGLSLERPTMIKYRINNIRDLFGHKANLETQRTAPIARF
jgi:phenylalanyl-tRNA synthetase alpha chain